jgi:hypothetical protein
LNGQSGKGGKDKSAGKAGKEGLAAPIKRFAYLIYIN